MGFVSAIITTVIIMILGGGLFYLVYLKTRKKKETWIAKVYRLSNGRRKTIKNTKDGKLISKYELNDLIPYATDTLEKTEKEHGITIYRLQKLDIITPAVDGGVVDYWGSGKREVSVVLDGGSATLLKKGYDKVTSGNIFNPLPHHRINILMQEIMHKKDRINQEKNVLQAITPWIVAGVCMFGLITISYIIMDGYVVVSENVKSGMAALNEMDKRVMERELTIEKLRSGTELTESNLGKQPEEKVEDIPIIQDG